MYVIKTPLGYIGWNNQVNNPIETARTYKEYPRTSTYAGEKAVKINDL